MGPVKLAGSCEDSITVRWVPHAGLKLFPCFPLPLVPAAACSALWVPSAGSLTLTSFRFRGDLSHVPSLSGTCCDLPSYTSVPRGFSLGEIASEESYVCQSVF